MSEITNITLETQDVVNGPAETFRNTINENTKEIKTKLEKEINDTVHPNLENIKDWPADTLGTITERFGGPISQRKIYVGTASERTSVESQLKEGDFWAELE